MILRRPLVASLVICFVALALTACGGNSSSSPGANCFDKPTTAAIASAAAKTAAGPSGLQSGQAKGTSITLVTHDSFALSEGTLEKFTAELATR